MTARAPALEGTLGDLSLPDLLGLLVRSGRSGTVRFAGPVPAAVHVAAGSVTFADTDGDPDVAAHLVAQGLDPEVVSTAAGAVDGGVPWADALVGAGAPAADARRAVRAHTVNALFEVLLATDDTFHFDVDDAGESGARGRFPMDLEPLLSEVEHRRRSWERVAATVPSTAIVLRLAPTLPDGVSEAAVSAADWPVLASLDGRRMLSDTVRALGRTSFEVCEAAHRLLAAGVVEPV